MRVLEDQIVLITGARGGLGTDITRAFLKAGARVVGSSRKIADSDFADPRFMGIPADLTNADEARKLADAVLERFQRMDALVHVTGGFAGGLPVHDHRRGGAAARERSRRDPRLPGAETSGAFRKSSGTRVIFGL